MCCSVLQCVAVCCSVSVQEIHRLQRLEQSEGGKEESGVLECVGVCWSVLERVGVCCSVLQCVARLMAS